jgi:hypothetical protein
MILHTPTILILFASFVTAVLGIYGGIFAFRAARASGGEFTSEKITDLETKTRLLLLVVSVVIVVRLFAMPIFYWALESAVPDILGAMCAFGVTRVIPGLTRTLQYLQFPVLFLGVGWLLLNAVDGETRYHPFLRRKLYAFSAISILIVLESFGDFYLFFSIRSPVGFGLSCCSTVADVASRPTALVAGFFLGPGAAGFAFNTYVLATLLFLAFLTLVMWKGLWRMPYLVTACIIAAILVPIFWIALIEKIAPLMMNLPYHHCIYCWVKTAPGAFAVAAGFLLGVSGVGWALVLNLQGGGEEVKAITLRYTRGLFLFSISSMLFSFLVVMTHTFMAKYYGAMV